MASQPQWVKGSPVEVYSNGLSKWCCGEIVGISIDNEGTCLELRYWDGAVSKAKYLDPSSPHVRLVANPQGETRFTWTIKSKMECWSNSRAQWFEACIVGLKEEKDGEWLQLSWEVEENGHRSTMTKEVLRTSLFIRPHYNSTETKGLHTKRTGHTPVSIEVNASDHDAEEDQNEVKDEAQTVSHEEPGSIAQREMLRVQTQPITEIEEDVRISEAGEDGFGVDDWDLEREEFEFKLDELQNLLKRSQGEVDDVRIEKEHENYKLKQANEALAKRFHELEVLTEEMMATQLSKQSVQSPGRVLAETEHLTAEIDRLNRELRLSEQKCIESSSEVETLTKKLALSELELREHMDEIKDLTAGHKLQIQRLEHDTKSFKKKWEHERNRRLNANNLLMEKQQELDREKEKMRNERRQNNKIADYVLKLRRALQKQNDDGSVVDSALRPPIRRRMRTVSNGDTSPMSTASTESRGMMLVDVYDAINSLEGIMSKLCYSDEEDTPQTSSSVSGSGRRTSRRLEEKPMLGPPITPPRQERPPFPGFTPTTSPPQPNGYHHSHRNSSCEPAEIPRGAYYPQVHQVRDMFPFSPHPQQAPSSYHALPEDAERDTSDHRVIPGIGDRSQPYAAMFSTSSSSNEHFFNAVLNASLNSEDAYQFVSPQRTRARSDAATEMLPDIQASPPAADRGSVDHDPPPDVSVGKGHTRMVSESFMSSSTDIQSDPMTPATGARSPSRRDTLERERLSVTSPMPNTPIPNTTVGSNEIVDTVNVKWPRRKKSIVQLNRNRHYETTRVSLREEGIQIEHYAGKSEPKFWKWEQLSDVNREHSQLVVHFGAEYIKMKLSTADQAENWYHLLQQRRRQSPSV